MKQIELTQIGSFTKTHGVQGHLALQLNDEVSFDLIDKGLLEKEAVFVEQNGIPVPFFIAENGLRELNSKTILVLLEDIDDAKAKKLYPCKVYLNTFYMDTVTTSNEEHPKNWIGYDVIDSRIGKIGKVDDFIDLKENPLLSVNYQNSELLIPLMSDFIISVDSETELITVELPDGYIDTLI